MSERLESDPARANDAKIITYLRAHGPATLRELALACDHSPAWLRRHLQKREGTLYRRVVINEGLQKWGLVEQEVTP